MDWDDVAAGALIGLGVIGLVVGLFFVYFAVCFALGLLMEWFLGWMGKGVADWYWTGVGLVALLGAVVSVKKSDD